MGYNYTEEQTQVNNQTWTNTSPTFANAQNVEGTELPASVEDINGRTSMNNGEDEATYTQINNSSLNVNNITYTNSTTAAVVGDGSKKLGNKGIICAAIAAFALVCIVAIGVKQITSKMATKYVYTPTVESVNESAASVATKQNPTPASTTPAVTPAPASTTPATTPAPASTTPAATPAPAATEAAPQPAKKVDEPKNMKISNMKMVETEDVAIRDGVEDTLGNKYDDAVEFSGYKDSYVTYYLGGKYTRFVANYSCLDSFVSNDNSLKLEIFGDDENTALYSLDYTRRLPVTTIDIDVSGVEFMTIRVTSSAWNGGIISDGMLYAD